MKLIETADITTKIYVKVLNFISYKMRSEKEISDRIYTYIHKEYVKKSDQEKIHDEVISRLKSEFYINDAKYADLYLNEVLKNKGKSIIEAKRFLSNKGVEQDVIEQSVNTFPDEYELDLAIDLAKKKIRSLSKDSPMKIKQKLTSFLARKGFSYDVIYSAVDSVLNLQ